MSTDLRLAAVNERVALGTFKLFWRSAVRLQFRAALRGHPRTVSLPAGWVSGWVGAGPGEEREYQKIGIGAVGGGVHSLQTLRCELRPRFDQDRKSTRL